MLLASTGQRNCKLHIKSNRIFRIAEKCVLVLQTTVSKLSTSQQLSSLCNLCCSRQARFSSKSACTCLEILAAAAIVHQPPSLIPHHRRSELDRWRIIVYYNDGQTIAQIAARIGCTRRTVYRWINAYSRNDVNDLKATAVASASCQYP